MSKRLPAPPPKEAPSDVARLLRMPCGVVTRAYGLRTVCRFRGRALRPASGCLAMIPEPAVIRCSCGGEIGLRYMPDPVVGKGLELVHMVEPDPPHRVKFVPASRSAAKHHSGARAALVRRPLASQPSGTPDTSPRQRPGEEATVEAGALSRVRTSQASNNDATLRALNPDAFWAKVDRSDPDGCWIWSGTRTSKGYGEHYFANTRASAHRVAYLITFGPFPSGKLVCHTCDNPPCVRPSHLFVGSNSDNQRDMHIKGRGPRFRPQKLTVESVKEILRHRANGRSGRSLAREFSVDRRTIYDIVTGRTWRSVSIPSGRSVNHSSEGVGRSPGVSPRARPPTPSLGG